MPWVGLQFVIVVFPDHTRLLLDEEYIFCVRLPVHILINGIYKQCVFLFYLPCYVY